MDHPKKLRTCVLGVFVNAKGQVLVCEREGEPGAWQLPQGGVESGETDDQAIVREMGEELGQTRFRLIAATVGRVDYDFPSDLNKPISKKYRGQSQRWYLMEFENGAQPDLEKATTREFAQWKWVSVADAIRQAVNWKKQSYQQGFAMFDMI